MADAAAELQTQRNVLETSKPKDWEIDTCKHTYARCAERSWGPASGRQGSGSAGSPLHPWKPFSLPLIKKGWDSNEAWLQSNCLSDSQSCKSLTWLQIFKHFKYADNDNYPPDAVSS